MGRVLTNGSRDPAFAAECLQLPGDSFLAEQMAVADPEGVVSDPKRRRRRIG